MRPQEEFAHAVEVRAPEPLDYRASRRRANLSREIGIGAQGVKAAQRVAMSVEQKPVPSVFDELSISAAATQHGGKPAAHCLDDDPARRLTPGGIGAVDEGVEGLQKVL